MVKQSRRQVKKRSLRRRTAKKRVMKRRAMKGGVYDGDGTYYRLKELPQVLYELTSEKDINGNMTFTLNFNKSNTVSIKKFGITVPDSLIIKTYKDAFIKAFDVRDDNSKTNIEQLMNKLFAGGIEGAKTRKLVISEKNGEKIVTIQLVENDGSTLHKLVDKSDANIKFPDFLKSLGDMIMPAPAASAAPAVLP
jgi:hypothetical protein